ncbi:hypothetical protein BU17DRAFT_103488 [Hysterangium stoloniferum]|nr:hypothetical protein BU17DRAFT_103488 [Hysterangium stoloniferum]
MAQALFDDHPIEHYLRESGDLPELMPGGIHEFATPSEFNSIPENVHYNRPNAISIWFKRPFECLLKCVTPPKQTAISQFAERFKYSVISSSLLSSSLSSLSSPTFSRDVMPTTPGHYDHSPTFTTPMIVHTASSVTPSHALAYSLACLVPVALAWGSYVSGIFLAAAVWILTGIEAEKVDQGPVSWSMTLETLDSLISANETWDSIVSESFRMLESDDDQFPTHRIQFSPPIHPLWLSLSSSLHTIQTQCDDVRQLLAALTSPLVLCQLTHMYAPPSPSRLSPVPTSSSSLSPRPRPISLAVPFQSPRPSSFCSVPDDAYTRSRTQSQPSLADKRATWNGTYFPSSWRSSKRHSNLSSLIDFDELKSPPAKKTTFVSSAPSTPIICNGVRDISEDADAEPQGEPFGVAALDLRRKRRTIRFGATSQNLMLTSSIGSRYTSLTPPSSTGNPQNLHAALQGAIGAKRFACAHLLALRFDDTADNICWRDGRDLDADEAYWEDVRSVITLLTSALEDASARLSDGLQQRRRERELAQVEERPPSGEEISMSSFVRSSTILLPPASFAPAPGHLARFSGHVDAISTALDDARTHLQQCLGSLREDPELVGSTDDSPLQSYDRLRRELGLALREYERGREHLSIIVERQKPHTASDEDEGLVQEAEVTAVDDETRHDEQFSSGESEKTLFNVEEKQTVKVEEIDYPSDDATTHLLNIATVQHLPLPGIEQIFEADSAAVSFTRPRSTLSRKERIALSRARRESRGEVLSIDACEENSGETKKSRGWGPGEEVVDELKDVIWKVREQRRKMSTRASGLDTMGLPCTVP